MCLAEIFRRTGCYFLSKRGTSTWTITHTQSTSRRRTLLSYMPRADVINSGNNDHFQEEFLNTTSGMPGGFYTSLNVKLLLPYSVRFGDQPGKVYLTRCSIKEWYYSILSFVIIGEVPISSWLKHWTATS